MKVEPEFERFATGHEAGQPQLVWTRLIADLETTISVMLKLADGRHQFDPAGIGRRRRRARSLFDHRLEAGR